MVFQQVLSDLMQITAAAQFPDSVFQGLDAHSALLSGTLNVQLQLSPLGIKSIAGLLQQPVGLSLPC